MTIMTTKDDKALAAPAVADGWMSQFEELLDDYAGACAETAVFNVTQRSGMTVGMARPRRKALMAHVRSIAAAPSAPSVSADAKQLPPLPAPAGTMEMNWGTPYAYDVDGYTADQMRGYAIDATFAIQSNDGRLDASIPTQSKDQP